MARLADGDDAAVFALHEQFGNRITGLVRRQLWSLGRHTVTPDELDELVMDACLVIRDVAGGWRPGGAQPWNWAQRRIRAAIARSLGIYASPLDMHAPHLSDDRIPAPCVDELVAETLARLVDEDERLALFAEATRIAGVDDVTLVQWLEYKIHMDSGDPSPAHTVGHLYGLEPATVRKRVSRARRRVHAVLKQDPRFADLADLALVA